MNSFEELAKSAAAKMAEHFSPIHGAGKLVDIANGKELGWNGVDSYRTEQDVKDTLDVDDDGDIDLDDASEALGEVFDGAGELIESVGELLLGLFNL